MLVMASSQLLAAQARLVQLQAAAKAKKHQDVPWEPDAEESVVACLRLPSHLGWGSTQVTAVLRQSTLEKEKRQTQDTAVSHLKQQFSPNQQLAQKPQNEPTRPDWVNHYPSLGIAAFEQHETSTYRVWLLCRYLDETGTGALDVSMLKVLLTAPDSPLRLFSWKRLKQVLYAGNGRFWHWQQTEQKIWLVGTAKLAQALQAQKLSGTRVQLPIRVVTAGIGEFRAHLYAAWHSGRRSDNPVSREVQRELTYVPERTQRHYGRIAKIKTKKNIAIGRKLTPMALEETAWQHGQAAFVYTDYAGELGSRNDRYLAWQLPNSYQGPHQQAHSGRQRKINQRLKQSQQLQNLVEIGAQGNRELRDGQLYHTNGSEAVQALGLTEESYWPTRRKRHTQFWAVLQLS